MYVLLTNNVLKEYEPTEYKNLQNIYFLEDNNLPGCLVSEDFVCSMIL